MLKVCYIITKLELGGAQKFTLYTAEHINSDDFQSFLIAGNGGMLDGEAGEKVRTYFLRNIVREISPLKDLKALFNIIRVLKAEKPDIVHTHSSKAGIVGRLAAKLAGVKVIVHTIHGYSFNDTQSWYKKYLYIFLEKICSLMSDVLIVESSEDIEKGLKHGIGKKDKFVIIPSGIDTQYYKNYKPDPLFRNSLVNGKNSKVVITIGPFKPQKNLQDYIKAAALVCKEMDDVKFFIVGDGELRPEFEKLINELGLDEKVILLGWRRDIVDLLYACDILVMTSLWEGLPRTILDAMCCAKPVIANDVGGIKDVLFDGKNGFLVQPYEYEKAAEKIKYLLSNSEALAVMGANAKNAIDIKYDINYEVKQQEDLYKELLRNNI